MRSTKLQPAVLWQPNDRRRHRDAPALHALGVVVGRPPPDPCGDAGVGAAAAEVGGGHQGSSGQPTALAVAPPHLHPGVRGRVGRHVQQVGGHRAAEAQDVES